MDILDSEATEDEAVQEAEQVSRTPSHEANQPLIEKEKRYRSIIIQAKQSDDAVSKKWDEWEDNIMDLMIDEVR